MQSHKLIHYACQNVFTVFPLIRCKQSAQWELKIADHQTQGFECKFMTIIMCSHRSCSAEVEKAKVQLSVVHCQYSQLVSWHDFPIDRKSKADLGFKNLLLIMFLQLIRTKSLLVVKLDRQLHLKGFLCCPALLCDQFVVTPSHSATFSSQSKL